MEAILSHPHCVYIYCRVPRFTVRTHTALPYCLVGRGHHIAQEILIIATYQKSETFMIK